MELDAMMAFLMCSALVGILEPTLISSVLAGQPSIPLPSPITWRLLLEGYVVAFGLAFLIALFSIRNWLFGVLFFILSFFPVGFSLVQVDKTTNEQADAMIQEVMGNYVSYDDVVPRHAYKQQDIDVIEHDDYKTVYLAAHQKGLLGNHYIVFDLLPDYSYHDVRLATSIEKECTQ